MARKMEEKENKVLVWAGIAVVVLVAVVLLAIGPTNQEEKIKSEKLAVMPPVELEAAACERIEPPFWATECNTAFERAYAYAFERYGAPDGMTKASLRISRQSGYYVFGFDYNGATACITVNAADLNDIKENEEACGSTTAS